MILSDRHKDDNPFSVFWGSWLLNHYILCKHLSLADTRQSPDKACHLIDSATFTLPAWVIMLVFTLFGAIHRPWKPDLREFVPSDRLKTILELE